MRIVECEITAGRYHYSGQAYYVTRTALLQRELAGVDDDEAVIIEDCVIGPEGVVRALPLTRSGFPPSPRPEPGRALITSAVAHPEGWYDLGSGRHARWHGPEVYEAIERLRRARRGNLDVRQLVEVMKPSSGRVASIAVGSRSIRIDGDAATMRQIADLELIRRVAPGEIPEDAWFVPAMGVEWGEHEERDFGPDVCGERYWVSPALWIIPGQGPPIAIYASASRGMGTMSIRPIEGGPPATWLRDWSRCHDATACIAVVGAGNAFVALRDGAAMATEWTLDESGALQSRRIPPPDAPLAMQWGWTEETHREALARATISAQWG